MFHSGKTRSKKTAQGRNGQMDGLNVKYLTGHIQKVRVIFPIVSWIYANDRRTFNVPEVTTGCLKLLPLISYLPKPSVIVRGSGYPRKEWRVTIQFSDRFPLQE